MRDDIHSSINLTNFLSLTKTVYQCALTTVTTQETYRLYKGSAITLSDILTDSASIVLGSSIYSALLATQSALYQLIRHRLTPSYSVNLAFTTEFLTFLKPLMLAVGSGYALGVSICLIENRLREFGAIDASICLSESELNLSNDKESTVDVLISRLKRLAASVVEVDLSQMQLDDFFIGSDTEEALNKATSEFIQLMEEKKVRFILAESRFLRELLNSAPEQSIQCRRLDSMNKSSHPFSFWQLPADNEPLTKFATIDVSVAPSC